MWWLAWRVSAYHAVLARKASREARSRSSAEDGLGHCGLALRRGALDAQASRLKSKESIMTFVLCCGASRQEVVERLLEGPTHKTLDYRLPGNTLWAIQQTQHDPYIACYLLARGVDLAEGCDDDGFKASCAALSGWGYRPLREGPLMPRNCPVDFLLMAPPVNPLWRAEVQQYHLRHSKSPVRGEVWTLKRACVPHVTIAEVCPRLVGTYAGERYPLSPSGLRDPIAQAFSPRVLPASERKE